MSKLNHYKNPKDSNIYRAIMLMIHTTPKGSHTIGISFFYKHEIPSGLSN